MVPDTVNGLPLHPLVVHAVVVLLPLACLGVIAVALRRAWRARYGALVVVLTAVATAAIPVATSSGENLEHRVGNPGEHAELGDSLIWFALPLLVMSAALVLLHRRAARAADAAPVSAPVPAPAGVGGPGAAAAPAGTAGPGAAPVAPARSRSTVVAAVLAVVIAVATLVQVYRVGDSGARAVWQGTTAVSPTGDR